MFHSNSNQFPSKKTSLTDPVSANSSGLGGGGPKYKESVCSTTPDSEIGIQHELLARINSSQSTLTSSLTMDDEHVSENIVELNFFYGIVKRNLLRYQNPITGLYPVTSSEKNIGSVRDTLYCCMSTWSLGQAFKKINDDKGKCYELCQSTVLALQGKVGPGKVHSLGTFPILLRFFLKIPPASPKNRERNSSPLPF